ncbi:MAG: ComEC/Rec2 family competence protein [Anaerolineae bacterium]
MTPLVLFTLAWAGGILLTQASDFHAVWLLLPIPPTLTLLVGWGDRRGARRAAAMLLGLTLGGLRFALAEPTITPSHAAFYRDRGVAKVRGVVVAEPDERVGDTRLRVEVEQVTLADGDPRAVEGRLLVYGPVYSGVRYGDLVTATGELETPPVFEDFSYRDYLARQGIFAMMRDAEIGVLASHRGNPAFERLLAFKSRAHRVVLSLLPEPQASLLAGILLGIEQGIPQELVDAFAATGTSHIVAISGFNLTLVAGVFAGFARRYFHRRGEMILALVGLWAYVLLVGASAAVLRAGVMSSLLLLARREGRPVHGPTSLAAAVLLLSLWQPGMLWDVGFQLSFAATLGMMLYVPPLTKGIDRLLRRLLDAERAQRVLGALNEGFIVTLAVQIATFGIMLGQFQQLSLVSQLANFLILPVQPYIMGFGGAALLAGLLLLPVGRVVAAFAWVFLTWTILVVEWAAALPAAAIELGAMALSFVWGYYLLLAVATWWFSQEREARARIRCAVRDMPSRLLAGLRPEHRRWAVATGAAAFVLLVTFGVTRSDGRLHVFFLDAGDGDAVFVQTPSRYQVLIDGGPDPPRTLAALARVMPWWDRSLDLVILTSPDEERISGLIPVLERYEVTTVAAGPETAEGTRYETWQALVSSRPDAPHELLGGDVLPLDQGISLRVLWPPRGRIGPVALQLEHGDVRVLLMGDATATVEAALVDRYGEALRSQVLQVARHGEKTSTSAALLQAVTPHCAVVGLDGGEAPSPFVTARLMSTPLYHTGDDGTVEVVSDGRRVKVRTRR